MSAVEITQAAPRNVRTLMGPTTAPAQRDTNEKLICTVVTMSTSALRITNANTHVLTRLAPTTVLVLMDLNCY